MRQKTITKCDRSLLQSASGIKKCDSYYKVRRNSNQTENHVLKHRQSSYFV